MKTWLLLDCHFLSYRAFHSTGDLSHNDVKTGVIYGFLRDIVELQDTFDTHRVVFCWDVGANKRKDIYPSYKEGRHETKTDEEVEAREEFLEQIRLLRTKYLPTIGFKNNFWQKGYECDDVIASIVNSLPDDEQAVIVSADKDFRQLIRHNVMLFNPNSGKRTTLQSFHKEFGIKPKKWAQVLMLSGCRTDNVKGAPGIGDTTALKYIRGELKETSKAYASIFAFRNRGMNRRLVKLPFEGTKPVTLVKDEITIKGWSKVCDELGIKSLRSHKPRQPKQSLLD